MIKLNQIKDKLSVNGKYWIAFTGDSITSTEWVHPNWREIIQYVLQEEMTNLLNGDWKTSEWGIKGFNFGYDGSTTKDILNKLDEIKIINPDLVIGLMGGNDAPLGVSISESVENILKIVKKLNIDVVWCNSTPAASGSGKNIEYKPYAKEFMKIGQIKNLQKINMFELFQKYPTDNFFTFISEENPTEGIKEGERDLIHPNQLGNAYIAKILLKEVFDIEFDAQKYWQDTVKGEKYPKYQ